MAFEETQSFTFDARNVKSEQREKMLQPLFEEVTRAFTSDNKDNFCVIGCGNSKNKKITLQLTGESEKLADLAALILRTVISKTVPDKNVAAAEVLLTAGEMLEQIPEIKKINPEKYRKMTNAIAILMAQLLEKAGFKVDHKEKDNEE